MIPSFSKYRTIILALSMGMILHVLRQNVLTRKKSALRILLAAILPLKSEMVFRFIFLGFALLGLVACKSPSVVTQGNATQQFITLHTHDTVVVHDSVFVSEKMQGDTVYLTRVEYRDRWRTHLVYDTVVKTDSIVQVIEHPPERYIPKFHKTCTWLFCIIVVIGIIYIFLRVYKSKLWIRF